MEDTKVRTVTEWPTPHTVRALQRFLGFATFYRRFIRGFSSTAAPLTALLKKGPKQLTWSNASKGAFCKLKSVFTTAPILHNPDLTRPFVWRWMPQKQG